MTIGEALLAARARLLAGGVASAGRDAPWLLSHALRCPRHHLTMRSDEPFAPEAASRLEPLIAARLARQPLTQILGDAQFWKGRFAVSEAVLCPRPETETIVRAALERGPFAHVLDLGTGSGAILLSLLGEWPEAVGLGTEISPAALGLARRNATSLGLADRVQFLQTDWLHGVVGRFDLIVCNPPYIPESDIAGLEPEVRDWEPRVALTAGPTGLEAYGHLAPRLGNVLAPGGLALFEVGAGQAADVADLFRSAGFAHVRAWADLDGRDRVIELR